jgi:hypothetical protein
MVLVHAITAPTPATPFKPAGDSNDGEMAAAHGTISESNPDDDDDIENWRLIAAIKAELKSPAPAGGEPLRTGADGPGGGRGEIRTHETPCDACRFSRPVP